ncbi:MAG: hypothetical protein FWE03_05140 [Firmicutes bacterium]|nr:hypothetical protein [Bacillota bacterium]
MIEAEYVGANVFEGWCKNQRITVSKDQSKKWHKDWNKGCKAKIIYK